MRKTVKRIISITTVQWVHFEKTSFGILETGKLKYAQLFKKDKTNPNKRIIVKSHTTEKRILFILFFISASFPKNI
jgi:hypothetical protein